MRQWHQLLRLLQVIDGYINRTWRSRLMVNSFTGASTVTWKPFTTLRPSTSFQAHFKAHPINTACHSSRVNTTIAVDPPDHTGSERPKELLEAQDLHLNRREWMVFATSSTAVAVIDATEANAEPFNSVQVEPRLDNIRLPEASSTTTPTGIQAIRTPSINRCPSAVLFLKVVILEGAQTLRPHFREVIDL